MLGDDEIRRFVVKAYTVGFFADVFHTAFRYIPEAISRALLAPTSSFGPAARTLWS